LRGGEMGLLFYLVLFIVVCFFGWSVKSSGAG
jgi:hypothetical protein